jgi:hypothetical protein
MALGEGDSLRVTKIRISRQHLVKNSHIEFEKSAQRRYVCYLIYD